MLSAVGDGLSGLTSVSSVKIDNHVFRLYYTFTTVILLTSSAILITSQLFGEPIDCLTDGSSQKSDSFKKTVDTFCWVAATYTLKVTSTGRSYKHPLFYDGIGQFDLLQHTQTYQIQYRWICFIFFIQGILFYLPFYFWNSWESGKMEGLSKNLDSPVEVTLECDRRNTRVALLLNHLEAYDLNSHEWYTYRLYFCEVLNLVMLVGNFLFVHLLLDNQFGRVGFEILAEGQSQSLNSIFPIHAKCLWKDVGPSGGRQDHDALCVLPLNTFNRIVFAFLWFWYILVGILTIGWLVFRIATIVHIPLRSWLLRWKGGSINSTHSHHQKPDDCIDFICQSLPHPDWFVLYQLADNTDSIAFQLILEGLCERLKFKFPQIHQRNSFLDRRLTHPDLVVKDDSKPKYTRCD